MHACMQMHATSMHCGSQTPWHHFVHPLKTGTQLLCTLYISQIFGMAALTKPSVPVTQALVDALNSTYFSQCPWLHHALKTKQMQVRINSEFQGKRFTTSYNKIENFGSTTNPGSWKPSFFLKQSLVLNFGSKNTHRHSTLKAYRVQRSFSSAHFERSAAADGSR